MSTLFYDKPKLIGEYFAVKLQDSFTLYIPKVPFHKEKMMPDHGISHKLAAKFETNQEIIHILLNIQNEQLFENLLKFSYTRSSELTISRCEFRDLEKIFTYFNLDILIQFVKKELQRIDFSST